MRAPSGRGRDLLLGLFAAVVLVGAVDAVRTGGSSAGASAVRLAPAAEDPLPGAAAAVPSASPTAAPVPSSAPLPRTGPVLVVGPDLAGLARGLAAGLRTSVLTAAAAPPAVLAPGALAAVDVVPGRVVLQVLAGSSTTTRTADALRAVAARWPAVEVLVVGPFSSQDRRSAAAARAAAAAAGATFLDPVALGWRSADTSPALTAADRAAVRTRLLRALSRPAG